MKKTKNIHFRLDDHEMKALETAKQIHGINWSFEFRRFLKGRLSELNSQSTQSISDMKKAA